MTLHMEHRFQQKLTKAMREHICPACDWEASQGFGGNERRYNALMEHIVSEHLRSGDPKANVHCWCGYELPGGGSEGNAALGLQLRRHLLYDVDRYEPITVMEHLHAQILKLVEDL